MKQQTDIPLTNIGQTNLEHWAREDANNDNARGVDLEFPSFDGRIQHIIQHYTATITTDFIDNFQSRSKRLRDAFTDIFGRLIGDPEIFVQETLNLVNTAVSAAEKQCAPKITDLQKELSAWEERFHAGFHNGIANPKKQNHVWHWGLVIFLLAVEVVLNSRFFAETSEYGLLGGTMAAVAVSVVNVGLPILLAYFIHKLYFSRGVSNKGLGIILAISLVTFAAVFNYQVAEYRNNLLISGDKPPASLPEYFALLIIGGGIAVISFWKMFTFLDPFSRPRRGYDNRGLAIKEYEHIALEPLLDAQKSVSNILQAIALRIGQTRDAIQQEEADFDFRCSEAVRESVDKFGYYHLKYCPIKVDPDPQMPDIGPESFNFSSAQDLVSNTIRGLEEMCKKADSEWKPAAERTRQNLVTTHQKFQAVVVANIQNAITKAN